MATDTTLSTTGSATHEVTNQPPPHAPYDAAADPAMLEGLRREGAGWAEEDLRRLGTMAGGPEAQQWSEDANRFEPELRTVDRYGNRIDEVDFHPSWHHLMRVGDRRGRRQRPRGPTTGPARTSRGSRARWCGATPRPGTAARCR